MIVSNDIHFQFAECFDEPKIRPFAYFLSKNLLEGNICIPIDEPYKRLNESPYQEVCDQETLLELTTLVATDRNTIAPFVLEGKKLYLHRYFRYENLIVEKIKKLVECGHSKLTERMGLLGSEVDLLKKYNANHNIDIATEEALKVDWQLVAVIQTLLQNFSIITGGPGTGKTTTLAKVLSVLYTIEPTTKVALAAPTGKASMRMFESLNNTNIELTDSIREKFQLLKPSTIHSLLGYIKGSVNFKYNSDNYLPFDLIIIDEASMIDVPMFAKLLDAMGPECRMILLGDKDQLASVEAGSLLGDLCLSVHKINQYNKERADWINTFIKDADRKIKPAFVGTNNNLLTNNIVELRYSHRFNIQGGIGKLSNAVLNNKEELIKDFIHHNDDSAIKIEATENEAILNTFSKGYEVFIQEQDTKEAIKKLNNLRVLVAVREGERGLYAINRKIELQLSAAGKLNIDKEFYENRPIIVTRNMHQLGLLNGDVGIIRGGRVWFEVPGESTLRSFLPAYITECETVFAMTIHKSQGSEFDNVLIVLPEGTSSQILTRELLYTGITRAKEQVTIMSSEESLLHASKANVERVSGITSKLV